MPVGGVRTPSAPVPVSSIGKVARRNPSPLHDAAPDLADPRLERARRLAQDAAGRPVSLQAMARWFLDLRSGLQGTPYVVLGG